MIMESSTIAAAAGLVSGYVFRFIKELFNMSQERERWTHDQKMAELKAGDESADRAAERPNTGYVRKAFVWAIIAAVPVALIVFAFNSKIPIQFPVVKEGISLGWGLITFGAKTTFEALDGYVLPPQVLDAFIYFVSFAVGQWPAKAR